MKTNMMVLLALLVVAALQPPMGAYAQQDVSVRGWVMVEQLVMDGGDGATLRNMTKPTYANSQSDTSARLFWSGTNFVLDSVQFCMKTNDTTRYRIALLFGCGTGAPYLSYVMASGVGLDTGSSVTALLNDVPSPMGQVPAGTQWIAPVVQFSAAGNGSTTAVAAKRYELWAKKFFRYKKQ